VIIMLVKDYFVEVFLVKVMLGEVVFQGWLSPVTDPIKLFYSLALS
jgi:hypothetical protein